MLQVKVIMNSSVGEVLAFKCCALPDQNLEVHLQNTGAEPVVLDGSMVLEGQHESRRIDHLYPPGEIRVPPEDVTAVYCYVDSDGWERYEAVAFQDRSGRVYRFPIRPTAES